MEKIKYKGYLFKVNFVGDSITPMYRFRMFKEYKFWFFTLRTLLWEEKPCRNEIKTLSSMCDKIIKKYNKDKERWKH